jgi:HlyD family secretion protein
MKRFLYISIFSVLAVICIGVIIFLFRVKKSAGELILYGNVDVRLVDIGFRIAGRVDQIFFEEGDWVEEGSLMAILDKSPYDSQVDQAQANVEAIQVIFGNAERLLKRREELIGIGGVSQEDLENAQTNRDQLWADLLQAKASLQASLDNLCYTEVFAPTDGFILTRVREPGTVVNPAEPVYTLSVASPVWIRAYVDEPNLGDIYYGMPAEITTDLKHGQMYTGQIGFISPMAEFTPKTVQSTELRTDLVYRLRIYADNPDNHLKQGMPVTVKLKKNARPRQ